MTRAWCVAVGVVITPALGAASYGDDPPAPERPLDLPKVQARAKPGEPDQDPPLPDFLSKKKAEPAAPPAAEGDKDKPTPPPGVRLPITVKPGPEKPAPAAAPGEPPVPAAPAAPPAGQGLPELKPGEPSDLPLTVEGDGADPTPAPLDPDLNKVQAPATPLAAKPAAADPAADTGTEAFVLSGERLPPLGKQGVGLTIDVLAPQFLNLHQDSDFKVVVRNTGATDAIGVRVRDKLPDGLEFVSSQPDAKRSEALLVWDLGTVPTGTERVITLRVKPKRIGTFDHAATVTMMAGARAQTLVREPKLKVEQTANTEKVLRGKPVSFKIAVTNTGNGPVRNVTIKARLSAGLRHESGELSDQNLLEQSIDLLNPGERVVLDTLSADAVAGGEQSCEVRVESTDVVTVSPDAQSKKVVTVIEPKLNMTLTGPDSRHTDTLATYELVMDNPGTAPARNVRVFATLPVSGLLVEVPPGASWDRQTRRLGWVKPLLEPGEKAPLSFKMRTGSVGQYKVAAEAKSEGSPPLLATATALTDVIGLADVDIEVSKRLPVIDVNEQTAFVIKITNKGTKDATKVLVHADLSMNIVAVGTGGTDLQANWNKKEHKLIFPVIERIPAGGVVQLGVSVKAEAPGMGSCHVYLKHEELADAVTLQDADAFKIMATRRESAAVTPPK